MTTYDLGVLTADIVMLALLAGVVAGIVFLAKVAFKPTGLSPTDADWYPDPDNPELLRYFDGESWTEATRPLAAPPGS
ncbi:DUF2510 domain-containing protein [[Mycobacterium] nativiensis]|uniref:DUF2510 domain-containing protein n=1 Tax=[Mycobacterium] nativiensis TaxID=2855503 RepID=A0ABU5XSH6_9MYCO|nr:DUF2510 domain-containing protein [Mycolicibacter sp. MYC340]MEB3030702.1 DUF2510 domain-containing protein [Mycolicibacter sp. MYC340]